MRADTKIGLLDHVGGGNLGDEATLDAVAANIKRRWPNAEIVAFSMNPDDTEARHGIMSHPIRRKRRTIGYKPAGTEATLKETVKALTRKYGAVFYLLKATNAVVSLPGMRQASKLPESAEKTVRDIRRATRRHHSAEEKIRIVLEGLRGEDSIAELCRKEGINQNLYYRWSKEFLEAGKKRLAGDTAREATSDEVKELKAEARQLKETLAEVLIENRLLKKSVLGNGEDASMACCRARRYRSGARTTCTMSCESMRGLCGAWCPALSPSCAVLLPSRLARQKRARQFRPNRHPQRKSRRLGSAAGFVGGRTRGRGRSTEWRQRSRTDRLPYWLKLLFLHILAATRRPSSGASRSGCRMGCSCPNLEAYRRTAMTQKPKPTPRPP